MTKEKKDGIAKDIEVALETIKTAKEQKGIIPTTNQKIVIAGTSEQYKGKILKVTKRLLKGGQNYSIPAGTKWEDIDNFHRINISFSKADFN